MTSEKAIDIIVMKVQVAAKVTLSSVKKVRSIMDMIWTIEQMIR